MREVIAASITILGLSLLIITGAGELTGALTQTYALTLNDVIRDFFNVHAVSFPQGECTQIPIGLYNNIAYRPISVTEDFTTTGEQERSSTTMYGFEEDTVGALELVKGKRSIPGKEDGYISIVSERPVRIPKLTRVGYIEMTLFGEIGDLFYVTKGSLRTPVLLCEFEKTGDGSSCKCTIRKTYDYGAGKVGVRYSEPERP
ncbi:hypothetical protein D6825_01855 [Candidatus Woesearchaeota archaeon]|nr:MAG: hypothetical protein D6825_01855 [Candidatus Woesearchaeota archaeon]